MWYIYGVFMDEYEYKQVKSRAYYVFWGTATLAVVVGQMAIAGGYRRLSESLDDIAQSINRSDYTLYKGFEKLAPRPRFIPLPQPPVYGPPIYKEIEPVPAPIPNFIED